MTEFSEASDSTKRRRTRLLRENFTTDELTYATTMKLRHEGKGQAAKICVQATSSTSKAAEILEKSNEIKESAFTPAEALNIMVKTDMSKESYIFFIVIYIIKYYIYLISSVYIAIYLSNI